MHTYLHHHTHIASYQLRQIREMRHLFAAHCLVHMANAFIFIFIPLYLYKSGYSVTALVGFYLMVGIFKLLLTPAAYYLIAKWGANRTMALGAVSLIAAFGLLATLLTYHWPLVLIAICKAANGVFYYAGFQVNFAAGRAKETTGQTLSKFNVAIIILGVIAPAASGFIASYYGINWLYGGAIILFAAASSILLAGKELRTFKLTLHVHWRQFKADYFSNFARNISGLADIFAWTLLAFLIIPSYVGMGVIGSISVLTLLTLTWLIGRRGDATGEKPFIRAGAFISAAAGSLRILAQAPLHVIGINFLSDVGATLFANSYMSRYYRNSDKTNRMGYMFGMELANSAAWVVFFGLLLIASLILTPVQVLIFGVLIGIPAAVLVHFIH